jgi:hypothetical protein
MLYSVQIMYRGEKLASSSVDSKSENELYLLLNLGAEGELA